MSNSCSYKLIRRSMPATAGFVFAVAVSLAPGLASAATSFSFGLWGDMPYAKANDGPKMKPLVDDMNASDIVFSLYDGDIKDGSSVCTDEVFSEGKALFNSLKAPVVYVPGDNEWTDCHRKNNGGYDNLERLTRLRKVMFDKTDSFGLTSMPLEHQGKPGEIYSENTRFTHDGIIFVGLNIPGSNNNKVLDEKDCTKKSVRTAAQCAADNAEYEARDKANIAWVREAFEKARAEKAPGIVLVFQADPGFDLPETEDVNEREDKGYSGYTNFLNALAEEALAYEGQVLVVHGDTHFFKLDKPLFDQAHMIPNLTRLETFGSPNAHWVKVTVDPASRALFIVQPMVVPANAAKPAMKK